MRDMQGDRDAFPSAIALKYEIGSRGADAAWPLSQAKACLVHKGVGPEQQCASPVKARMADE
eukprot:6198304-Pleurochrysis_carterae.AAC.1